MAAMDCRPVERSEDVGRARRLRPDRLRRTAPGNDDEVVLRCPPLGRAGVEREVRLELVTVLPRHRLTGSPAGVTTWTSNPASGAVVGVTELAVLEAVGRQGQGPTPKQ